MTICARCGGTNVQVVCWVDPNTQQVLDEYWSHDNNDGTWCNDCDDHTGVVEKPDFKE